jgi:hypothetical protein
MNPIRAQIRTLFLHPQPTYAAADTPTLLAMQECDVRQRMELGELEAIETRNGIVLLWEELVSFAMERWSQEVIENALGRDVTTALPELVRLADLQVRIPQMQVVALERLAEADGVTVSVILARELRDFVSVHAEWLSREVPRFAAAFAWPECGSGGALVSAGSRSREGASPHPGNTPE